MASLFPGASWLRSRINSWRTSCCTGCRAALNSNEHMISSLLGWCSIYPQRKLSSLWTNSKWRKEESYAWDRQMSYYIASSKARECTSDTIQECLGVSNHVYNCHFFVWKMAEWLPTLCLVLHVQCVGWRRLRCQAEQTFCSTDCNLYVSQFLRLI